MQPQLEPELEHSLQNEVFTIMVVLYAGCPKKSGVLVWNFNF